MTTSSERSRANKELFDKAATSYFAASLSFFEVLGERLIDHLAVSEGQRVLDLGCGAGASTLPAARRTGRTGRVVGVDISPKMLDIAARRARDVGVDWITFYQADIASLDLGEKFDAGVCGYTTQMFDDLTAVPRGPNGPHDSAAVGRSGCGPTV